MSAPATVSKVAGPSVSEFMSAAPAPLNGSSPWASRYAGELKRVIYDHAARAPRTLQQHLGPSELGAVCDRQVAGKMAALPATNHVADPWASIMGTAGHAWVADAFDADNLRTGIARWVTETKVTPHPDHPGTADLYDAVESAVVDHKFLGESSLAKIKKDPPRHYRIQLKLYGLGYLRLGLPVRRIVLAAYPRTKSSLDAMYVWEEPFADEANQLLPSVQAELAGVFEETAVRRGYADELVAGRLQLMQVPGDPTADECYFCPFYRPQAARDGGVGCPGAVTA